MICGCAIYLSAMQGSTSSEGSANSRNLSQNDLSKSFQDLSSIDGIPISCQLAEIDAMEDRFEAERKLSNIAISYVNERKFEQALEIVKRIKVDMFRWRILSSISSQYAKDDLYDKGLQIARSIPIDYGEGSGNRWAALSQIALQLARTGQSNRADQVIQEIDDISVRAITLANIAKEYARLGNLNVSNQFFSQAVATVKKTSNGQRGALVAFPRDYALSRIAVNHAEVGQYQKAIQLTQAIQQDTFRIGALQDIAVQYGKTGQSDQAVQLLSETLPMIEMLPEYGRWRIPIRSNTLAVTAVPYANAGLYKQALQIVKTAQGSSQIEWVLIEIATIAIKNGEVDNASKVLEESLRYAATIKSRNQKADFLIDIADKYLQLKEINKSDQIITQALQIEQENDIEKERILERIANMYVRKRTYGKASLLAQTMKNMPKRNKLVSLIQCASQAYKLNLIE
jgi:tetratricopeptide (TPR) repeat protein